MGAGKTTLGKSLSRSLNIPFYDLDHLIEEKEGKTIAQIFNELGEGAFRKLEGRYLKEFNYPDQFILSTGGGTPCFYDHLPWMNREGITIYLQLSPKSLAIRLQSATATERPLLKEKQGEELLQFIEEKLLEREPFYLRAQYILKGENLKVEDVVDLIKKPNFSVK